MWFIAISFGPEPNFCRDKYVMSASPMTTGDFPLHFRFDFKVTGKLIGFML